MIRKLFSIYNIRVEITNLQSSTINSKVIDRWTLSEQCGFFSILLTKQKLEAQAPKPSNEILHKFIIFFQVEVTSNDNRTKIISFLNGLGSIKKNLNVKPFLSQLRGYMNWNIN